MPTNPSFRTDSGSPRPVGSRSKHLNARRQKALETRWRIMDAAHAEFTARGYHDTTMAAIADRAGVSVQTVYLVFRTKSGLLDEIVGNAVLGRTRESAGRPPLETAEFLRALKEPDGTTALALWVKASLPVYERTSAIADAGKAAYLSDPDIADWWERSEALRLEGSARMVEALAGHHTLRSDLSVSDAADILSCELSPQSFLAYTVDRGWSVQRLAAWLSAALPRLLVESCA